MITQGKINTQNMCLHRGFLLSDLCNSHLWWHVDGHQINTQNMCWHGFFLLSDLCNSHLWWHVDGHLFCQQVDALR